MSDLLSSISILLAVLSFLYSSWYNEIQKAKKRFDKNDKKSIWPSRLAGRQGILWGKVFVFGIANLAVFIIYFWKSYEIILEFSTQFKYDPTKASIVLIMLFFCYFICEHIHSFISIRNNINQR